MKDKIVITISREYGSGGRELGRILADTLEIPFYDKELMTYMAKESGIDEDLFKQADDKIRFANFYFLEGKHRLGRGALRDLGTLGLHERIQQVQEKLIKDLAKDSCVIIGRCSNYILRHDPEVISIFIRADLMDKKRRATHIYGESIENINDKLLEVDSQRANYYNYFTDQIWGKASNYDMVLSTSQLSLEDAAKVIETFIKARKK